MSLTQLTVPISRIFLDLENPRFEPVVDESAAILHLARDEKVAALAEDIVSQNSLNPLEIIGVIRAPGKVILGREKYTVLEGNRRVCAIKLLRDPDSAPPDQRKRFAKLSSKWKEIKSLNVIVFPSREEAKPWLERLHEGEKDGVGRKAWNAIQKTRFSGAAKNAQSMCLLDIAEKEGWASRDETDGILTTVQRFLNNPIFRNQLGISGTDREVIRRSRPHDDFMKLAEVFVKDAVKSKGLPMKDRLVHSRANAEVIQGYANQLIQKVHVSGERIDPEIITAGNALSGKGKLTRKVRPRPPEAPKNLNYERDIYESLKKIGNQKLTDIYYSICSLDLGTHPVLISVGVWSFFECLTAAAGRNENTAMTGFLSRSFLQTECGVGKDSSKAVHAALETISARGNDSKHHEFAGSYDPKEINNNWVVCECAVKGLLQKISMLK